VVGLAGHGADLAVDLSLAAPLCLLAMVAPSLRSRGGQFTAAAAVPATLLSSSLPAGIGLLVASAAGALAGLVGDRTATGGAR
jgi:predicted branched-subunit amino acid permease